MEIFYKFLSAKDFSSIECGGGPFISVGSLKRLILESKYKGKNNSNDPKMGRRDPSGGSLCMGTDLDLQVINAKTNEVYVDDSTLIVANSSVLLRRVPGSRRRKPIDTTPIVSEPLEVEQSLASGSSGSGSGTGSSVVTDVVEDDDPWGHDFGEDVFALPGAVQVRSNNMPAAAIGGTGEGEEKDDEESKIKALVNTPSLEYYGSGGNKLVSGHNMLSGRGFGRTEGRIPPEGYVCHRCNVPGHFIQHCPTNGDPKYDFKRVRPPTGIPKSMLVMNPVGSHKLPSGVPAVLQPDEDTFNKEMEGLSSSSHSASVRSIPPELHCPLCKQVMKDAVLTSRCCFDSFCDKCIRNHLINSKLKCVCGKSNMLTDSLVPNMTLREAIKRILESGSCSSSSDNVMSVPRVKEVESASRQSANGNIPTPARSVLSTKERKRASPASCDSDHFAKKPRSAGATDISEVQSGSADIKEPAVSRVTVPIGTEVQKKTASSEMGKKKRKKVSQQEEAEGYMTPTGSYAYGMQPWMQGYVAPYTNALPYTAYGLNSFQLPYFNDQGYMMPRQGF